MESSSACKKSTQDLTDADFIDSSAASRNASPIEAESSPSTPSKRQHPRRSAKWTITVRTTQGQQLKGKTVNASKEGMMVSLPVNLKLGSKAFIEANVLYRGTQFSLQGVTTVKHSSISGSLFNIGFQFTVATDVTTRFLARYASKTI